MGIAPFVLDPVLLVAIVPLGLQPVHETRNRNVESDVIAWQPVIGAATLPMVVVSCGLCPRAMIGVFAVTTLRGEDWRRSLISLCGGCHQKLKAAGLEGRKLRGRNERWWLGHGVGRYPSAQPRLDS